MEYKIDATNKKLGRLASEIAVILQGKKSPAYEPRLEGDDSVVVENIDKMVIDSKKQKQKIYYRHTTQIGHLKEQSLADMLSKKGPGEVLRKVVREMLPENKLRIRRMKKLTVK